MLSTEEVLRFISPPPADVRGFERFIQWAHAERSAGRYACFAIVPAGYDVAVGIVAGPAARPGVLDGRVGRLPRVAVLGHRRLHGRRAPAARLRLRRHRCRIVSKRAPPCRTDAATAACASWGPSRKACSAGRCGAEGEHHDQILWSILAEDWRQLADRAPPEGPLVGCQDPSPGGGPLAAAAHHALSPARNFDSRDDPKASYRRGLAAAPRVRCGADGATALSPVPVDCPRGRRSVRLRTAARTRSPSSRPPTARMPGSLVLDRASGRIAAHTTVRALPQYLVALRPARREQHEGVPGAAARPPRPERRCGGVPARSAGSTPRPGRR